MKTVEEYQAIVEEIREVCRKHHVVLIGTDDSEGIYGEITIADYHDLLHGDIGWKGAKDRITNTVEECDGLFFVKGIA